MQILREEKIEHGTTFSVTCTEIFQGYFMANCRPQRKSDIFLQQEWQHSKECIHVSKENIVLCDYQESVTSRQTHKWTDRQTLDVIPMCHLYASQATQNVDETSQFEISKIFSHVSSETHAQNLMNFGILR